MKKWWAYVPAIVVMIIIFSFSAKNAQASTNQSAQFSGKMFWFADSLLHFGFSGEQLERAMFLCEKFCRKAAHFGEYMLLGGTVLFGIGMNFGFVMKAFLSAEFICILYAASDEIHQFFVPGRTASVYDVLLDSLGALLTIILWFAYNKKRRKAA